MKARILTIFVLTAITATSLSAGVVPGRWEKLDVLDPGSKIVLTSKAGDSMRYTFKGADSTSLTVRARGGQELVIPKSHVAKVVQQNSRSSKPAWIGAAIGGGTGVAMGVGGKGDEGPLAKREVAGPFLGLIGAAVGYTVGYLCTENPPDAVLYQDGPGK
jgi:hypothetical protein